MQEIIKINDYDVNLDLLINQYQIKEKFTDILKAYNVQCEDLEQALFEIRDNYWITTAEGPQLDVIGYIQDITRNGLTDSDYRTIIKAKIAINNGSGEFETIIAVLISLFQATIVRLRNLSNANLSVYADISITEEQFNTILNFFASGVGVYFKTGTPTPFVFDGNPNGKGFGKLTLPANTPSNDKSGGNYSGIWLS